MELSRYRIEVPTERTIVKVYPLGDLHLGATNCDYDAACRVRDMVAADPYARWIGMGDQADSIMPNDPRWDSVITDWKRLKKGRGGDHDESDIALEQEELVDRFYDPIWSKCIGYMKGNHEDAVERRHYVNITRRLCRKHEVPYLGYVAMVRLDIAVGTVKNKAGTTSSKLVPLDIFMEHGGSGGGTDGNAVNQHAKRLDDFDAEIYLKGHVHKRWIVKRTQTRWGPVKPIQRQRLLVGTGTFLRGYDQGMTPYPEKKGMPPNEIGSTVILIRPLSHPESGRGPIVDAVYTEALEMFSA